MRPFVFVEGRGGVEPPRPLRTTGLQPVLVPYETTYPDWKRDWESNPGKRDQNPLPYH